MGGEGGRDSRNSTSLQRNCMAVKIPDKSYYREVNTSWGEVVSHPRKKTIDLEDVVSFAKVVGWKIVCIFRSNCVQGSLMPKTKIR